MGHGLIGTTHAEDVESLVNRVVEQGLPPYLLREIDLVVFPRHVDGERYVGEVVELLDETAYERLDRDERCGVVRKQGTAVYWNTVAWRQPDGEFAFAYDHPALEVESGSEPPGRTSGNGGEQTCDMHAFERVAALTDRSVEDVRAEFHRKHRYVQYFLRESIDDFGTLFDVLADLETDEAATVERFHRQQRAGERTEGRQGVQGTDD